jgi:long-subunit acyl-CoA synthetase (AMP-forming)
MLLQRIYDNEREQANNIFLTQPTGQGQVQHLTWAEAVDQSRRMAAHLKSLGLPHGAKVAILSKNCAHFFLTE